MLKFNTSSDIHETSICDDDYRCNICYYDELETETTKHKGFNVTKLISCNYIQYGDYDNSCAVERANVRYLKENNLIEHEETGSYNYVKAWLLDTTENRDLLNELFNYPCFDDDIVSELESEMETEMLKDCGRDLHSLLSENIQEAMRELHIFDDIDLDCYYKACEESNTYFEVEAGGNGYIDFERIVKDYAIALCDKHPGIKSLCSIYDTVNNKPVFPIEFYESADDMFNHLQATGKLDDTTKELLAYTVELEKLIEALKP